MKLTRKQAVVLLGSIFAGYLGRAQESKYMDSSRVLTGKEPKDLIFDLKTFRKFKIRFGEEEIVITPVEIFNALKKEKE